MSTDPAAARRALVVLAVLTLIWGYNWVVMKVALEHAGALAFAAIRTGIAAVCLLLAMVATGRPLRPPVPRWTLLLGLLQTAAYTGFTSWALLEGAAGKTSVLVYTMPFWALLFAWLVLGEKLRGLRWLAVAMAGVGLALILEPWHPRGGIASDLWAVAGGAAWAASAVVAKRLRREHEVDLLSLTAWQMVFGLVPLLVAAWLVPERPLDWGLPLLSAMFYAGVLGTAAGWFMWLYVLHRLPAGTASLNSLAIPVVAVVTAWLQLGEWPSHAELAGMVAIAIGLGLMSAVAMKGR